MKCPVCLEEIKAKLVETHTDPIEDKAYKVYLCPSCEVEFSEPMKNPGPEWYQKFTELWGYKGKSGLLPNWQIEALKKMKIDKRQPKLLDIGCGRADFLLEAEKLGYQVTGIDFDEEKAIIARNKGLKDIIITDFQEFYNQRMGEKWDIITFFELLEHMEKPNEFIDMVKELLTVQGYIMLDIPNNKRILKTASGIMDCPPHHLTRWSSKSLLNFLKKKGFKIMTTTTIYSIRYFYDALFSFFSINVLAVLKKLLFKEKAIAELKTIPIDSYHSSLLFFRKRSVRDFLLKITKWSYNFTVLPATIFLFFPLLAYFRRKDRGLFIFVVAKK